MQNRMKNHQLTDNQIANLLAECTVATVATINRDGTPYITPIHFVYAEGKIYFHGLPAGQKLSNIKNNPSVCFNAYSMKGLLYDPDEKPCDTNTEYESVVIDGKAELVDDIAEKGRILKAVVKKYTPMLTDKDLPENMVKGTAVICITPEKITGKYYK